MESNHSSGDGRIDSTGVGRAGGTPRVELYRSRDAGDTDDGVLKRLRNLEDVGRLRAFELVRCGDCAGGPDERNRQSPRDLLRRRYRSFEQWAETYGRELVGFEQQTSRSVLTGSTTAEVVFPDRTLAEYRDGRLSFVAPSADEHGTTTVSDRIETY